VAWRYYTRAKSSDTDATNWKVSEAVIAIRPILVWLEAQEFKRVASEQLDKSELSGKCPPSIFLSNTGIESPVISKANEIALLCQLNESDLYSRNEAEIGTWKFGETKIFFSIKQSSGLNPPQLENLNDARVFISVTILSGMVVVAE
jgi:hypothetical protein